MIIYGRNAVHEALRGSRSIRHVWAAPGALREPWLAAATAAVPVSPASAEEILARSHSDGHQGICAEVDEYHYAHAPQLLAGDGAALIVVLDQVQDPQNLGAICRSAECAGATGVVLPERRSAEVTPAVCKASAGAVEHLAIAEVRNLADFLASAKAAGFWCYGATADGTVDYRELDWGGRVVLVLGSEGRGLRPRVAGACDALVALPLRGRIGSLSVSAAAAVLLYAATADRHR